MTDLREQQWRDKMKDKPCYRPALDPSRCLNQDQMVKRYDCEACIKEKGLTKQGVERGKTSQARTSREFLPTPLSLSIERQGGREERSPRELNLTMTQTQWYY